MMIDVNDEVDNDLEEDDEYAIETFDRLEDELKRDDSGHQRYSRRGASTAECEPIADENQD